MEVRNVTVSIIIVFYNGIEALKKCLSHIRKYPPDFSYEVIVVNNGEEKIETIVKKILTNAVYIKSHKNVGYGKGNNIGAKHSKGTFLFILNPDTYIQKGTIDKLCTFLQRNRNAAVVAPTLLYPNGTMYELQGTETLTPFSGIAAHSFVNTLFPKNPISQRYYLLNTLKSKVREVKTVPGCAFLIRKSIFSEVGQFDEKIFLYFEESDLGMRLQKKGYKLFIIPNANVIHDHSFDNSLELKKYNKQSRFYYFKKHYGLVAALLVELFARFSKRVAYVFILVVLIVAFILNL